MRTEDAPLIRLEDYRPSDWLIDTVDLDVSLHPTKTRVRSLLSLRPNPAGQPGAPLTLDGDELSLKTISLDGKPLDASAYAASPQALTIHAPPRRGFTLTIETEIDPSANTKLMGLYRSSKVYCTQCEADGFRRITYFLDRPDVMSVYTVRLEAAKAEAPVLLSNGNLVAAAELPGGERHFAVWHDPHPKPAYLFALVGGALDHVRQDYVTADGHKVELAIYVEPGKAERAGWALDSLVRCMRWDEQVFGRNYDLDVFSVVAVSDFNMGAMENKGLNIFNDKYVLADPQTATDGDYASIEAIIAHEYFHNWTGNRITCRDWFQLCLKEGLTVFRDQEFSADERSRPVKRIADVRTLRSTQFSEDAGPLAHPVRPRAYKEINNFYTPTVYEKGAEVIRMLKVLIGDDAFRRGMDLYFERCDGTAATIEEFLACFAEASAKDLSDFARWYEQAGTPTIVASGRYDAATQRYTLDLAQSTPPTPGQSDKKPMVLPIKLGLVGAHGDLPLKTQSNAYAGDGLVVLDSPSLSITFEGVTEAPIPSLLRGFSAPARLELDLSDADLVRQFSTDSDSFNRWQALQSIATRALVAAGKAGAERGAFAATTAKLGNALDGFLQTDALADPAFAAQVLRLPAPADIAREIGKEIDPDAIFAAHRALSSAIGTALLPRLSGLRQALETKGPYKADAASAGRRALRNELLGLTALAAPEDGARLCEEQFETADNLTDRLAALAAMTLVPGRRREALIARFSEAYAGEPLVLDKWLMAQALIAEPETLDRVKRLMQHPAFSLGNPNRVRALIGGFAANLTQFNRADGEGYGFVADMVTALDRTNPQVASRLLGSFKSWRMLEPGRRRLAQEALALVARTPNLSRDVSDIAERALA
ncbi:MAG: aminopeptidase N [Bosea sp.]|uniref:aminopeptidase N n=2 Tax=Bosea TaxID=85413 RepID=UPI00095DE664|nr:MULTISPECIES: aminopeptidase N [unclassified Bosea (in: a-proteobacteria)]MBN9456664.1 aminopeptidase N [Bosea sp. (in: a-proteobacteria)]OJV08894.1 MAG: aminopeptidase N [Bosea sp. 67-29]